MKLFLAGVSLLMPVLTASLASGQSTAPPFQNWSHVQAVTVAEAGLVRMEIPPATQAVAQPGLGDLRIIRSDGVETPYLVEAPTLDAVLLKPVRSVQTQLQDQQSILKIETGREEALRALVLRTAAGNFLKAVTLEGSQDGAQWQSLSEPTVLFQQPDGSSRLRLRFTPGSWKHLRVTVDDQRTSPVVFTGAEVELQQEASATVAEQVTVQQTEESGAQTRLTLKLQTPNAWLGSLKLQTTESVFSRRAVLKQLADGVVVAEATVFRLGEGESRESSLVIPVNRQVAGGELLLTLENGSSPPLKIQAVDATRYPVHLVFQADSPGVWQLYGGNARVAAPRYDLAVLGGQLKTLTARAAPPGPLMANPDFKKDAGLAPFAESGGRIDTSPWRRRKAVTTDGSGVQSLLLDLETVSHSAGGGGDLRLVQDGRQIPYILRPKVKKEIVTLPVQVFPDTKRPSYSRWKLELPQADIPVESLQLAFATPFLDRTFLIRVEQIDQAGQSRWQEYRRSYVTRKSGGESVPLLALDPMRISGRQVIIETDNGDNTPVELASATLSYSLAELRFQVASTAPVHLYYDHSRVSAPQYDLRLVQEELLAARPSAAALGTEEILKPGRGNGEELDSGMGTILLWTALGLVAAGLLWMVRKLVPEEG